MEAAGRARAADTQGVWGAPPQFAAGLREVKAEAREGSSSSEAGEISGSPDSPTPLLEGPEPPSRSPLADMLPEDSEPLVPPQPQRDDAVSPSNVCHTAEEQQVKAAEECMQSCFEQIVQLEDILEASQPDTGGLVAEKIRETMVQLVTTIRESSRVQNIAECRLEVAASLYLIFKMIIPVM